MIKFDDKITLVLSIITSVILLIFGIGYMLGQWEYSEQGNGILAIIFAVACFAMFFALRFVNILQIFSLFILMGLILFYANMKFDWQRTYIENAESGKNFILNSYISTYPTLEEHHFGSLWGAPLWVHFAQDCIEPALKGMNAGQNCKSNASIIDHYNIDAKDLVNKHFSKMKRTAQKIEDGSLKGRRQYQACLNNKTCAIIPLLPASVDPDSIDPQSAQYLSTRKMFWSLINDRQVSPEVCDFIDLCRALRVLDVMPIAKPGATPES